MLELLATYSITEILVFIVMLALAFKGVVSFVDWFKNRFGTKINGKTEAEIQEEAVEEMEEEARNSILQGRLLLGEQRMREHDEKFTAINDKLTQMSTETEDKFNKLTNMVELLLTSDRDSIKAYIVDKHHYFYYNKKWIDDYSMDCIEKKYETYKLENGNSYVEELVKQLRSLPKRNPSQSKDKEE